MTFARDLAALAPIAGQLPADLATLKARPSLLTDLTESYAGVPLGTGAQTEWRTIYAVSLGDVVAGDKWLALSQGELEIPYSFDVECAPWLTWCVGTPAGTNTTGHTSVGFFISGRNTNRDDEHYFDWCRVGAVEFVAPAANVWICMSVRCRSSGADGSLTQTILVKAGQGGLQALKLN